MPDLLAGAVSVPAQRRQLGMLSPKEEEALLSHHLQKLEPKSRYFRFGRMIGDAAIHEYCASCRGVRSLIYSTHIDGELRAVAEIRLDASNPRQLGELAMSVEDPWQFSGIGTELLQYTLTSLRLNGISRLNMILMSENHGMRKLAKKHGAHFDVSSAGQTTGYLDV
ncbi:MAG: GNAT family N-acetyltransferase [Sneathiella sp.]